MVVIPDMKYSTIDAVVSDCIDNNSHIATDASASHVHFKDIFARHIPQVIEPKEKGRMLSWIHIAIANAKTLFAGWRCVLSAGRVVAAGIIPRRPFPRGAFPSHAAP